MGDRTNIAWTDRTWNPWQGCHRVSEACKRCYMFRDKRRYGHDPETVVRSKPPTFRRPLSAKWREEPRRVFTCSWSDFFIEEADQWRCEAWDIIRGTPEQTYQILTKRPERIPDCLPTDWEDGYPNVWLGFTGENHNRFYERLRHAVAVPATAWFASLEPLLGPIDMYSVETAVLSQVIVGCESGPRARPTDLAWVRSIRDYCVQIGTAFFLKQLVIDGRLVETPEIDGRRWTQFPETGGQDVRATA
jgi:protein gp37